MTHAKPELVFQLADLCQTGRRRIRKGRKAALISCKKITCLPAKTNAKLMQKAAEILHTSTYKAAGYLLPFFFPVIDLSVFTPETLQEIKKGSSSKQNLSGSPHSPC